MKTAIVLEIDFILDKVLKKFVPHYFKLYTDSRYNVPKDVYNFFKLRLKGLNQQKEHKDNKHYLLYPKSRDIIGFNEYTFNQIETIIDKYMKAEYIQSDMLSHNMESAYKRECAYKHYWDELVQHLKEFIRELYNGK